MKHYICFHDRYHLKYMVSAGVEAFLTHLTVKKNIAALTQNQTLKSFALL
ncbi:phage integrase N-terminal SAM-like domain-containing protein [Nostoc sp.]